MKVVQVTCPSCHNPIQMKTKDQLFLCSNCGTLHVRDGGITVVDYEIADFAKGAQLENRIYVPFWRVYCSFVINHAQTSGGTMFKLANWARGGDKGTGDIFVFVPASDFDPATFRRLATTMTVNPPRYSTRMNFGDVSRLPAAVRKEEASELADFIVVTMEAEKPGVLQELDYSLTVKDSRIVFLPFVSSSQGLVPGL
ncbi:MAG: hypothetical protein LUO79_09265 [Methanomassiliicoccales archaeon]|nr:hypothetical protein [Methanomassiliicoccales archaeon]